MMKNETWVLEVDPLTKALHVETVREMLVANTMSLQLSKRNIWIPIGFYDSMDQALEDSHRIEAGIRKIKFLANEANRER